MAGANYAVALPHDKNVEPIQGSPAPIPAKVSWGISAQAASSVINLGDSTTMLEVTAVGGTGATIKWITSTDTTASVISSGATSNFDHAIPAGQTRRFVVPVDTTIKVQPASIMGVNGQNGLFKRVAWTSSASIFGTEY